MPENNLKISNSALLKSLLESALSENEKKEFEGLLETMTEEEKTKLIQLINESNQTKKQFEAEKTRQLAELNIKTDEQLKVVEQSELKYVREEVEKFDQQQTENELNQTEGILGSKVKNESLTIKEDAFQIEREFKNTQKSSHNTRNFVLIILGLLILGIVIIYGLLTL